MALHSYLRREVLNLDENACEILFGTDMYV